MTNYLNITLSNDEILSLSSTALAHIGDAVFELMVRGSLVKRGLCKASDLHRNTVLSVSASAQASAAEKLSPFFTDEEMTVFRRARNAKVNSIPKHSDPATYHTATAFEALFGYLYLCGKVDRLNELFLILHPED